MTVILKELLLAILKAMGWALGNSLRLCKSNIAATHNPSSGPCETLVMDCAIITWRGEGDWEMGKIWLKIKSHLPPLTKQKLT